MRLDRTFTTQESEQVAHTRIASYLESKGYKQRETSPALVYERGSAFGSMVSFSTKHWKVVTTVQTNSNPDETTNVIAVFDINTTGQMVVKRERDFWEKELAGLVAVAGGFNEDVTLNTKIEEKLSLEKRHNEGAKWFYWIAGLSIINSIIILVGGNINFLVGLGITQLIDGISIGIVREIAPDAELVIRGVAFILDLLIAGIFVIFGILAKKHKWAFIVGMIVYALDGLVFLLAPDFLSIGFHLFALYGLYSGLRAFGKLKQQELSVA